MRRPSESALCRFVAHLLIRLLILTPLPAPWQTAAAMLPLSLLWPLVGEGPSGGGGGGAAEPVGVSEDPSGNVTTFEKSEFVDPATGRTAVGPGGGTVLAADDSGAELRIPEGALDQGVVLKIEAFGEEALAELLPGGQRPEFEGAQFGGGLKVTADREARFKKEADLAFPLPANLPAGVDPKDAFYYVYRKVEKPGGKVIFEVVDHAFVEGEGENAKVVTASAPFLGFIAAGGLDLLFLAWTLYEAFPAKTPVGVIEGKVLRTTFVEGSAVPTYVGIEGAVVSATDDSGTPLQDKDGGYQAQTGKDGTYALWDHRFTGGTVKLVAKVGGETREATAYEVPPNPRLSQYQHQATANITFPPLPAEVKPPLIVIKVFRQENGQRVDTAGLVVANQPLVIGFTAKNAEVRSATVNGREYGVRRDPLMGSSTGMDHILDPDFTPTQPGSYTVVATALPTTGPLVPLTSSSTFRVVAEGGSNNDPLPDEPPKVITARTVPKANATGVAVVVFPQVVFTEPVKNVPGNVTLTEEGGSQVGLKLSGVGPSGPIADLTMSPEAVVTSLTIQPMVGLKYGTRYTLALTAGITDLDPEPKGLVPESSSFTTFGPTALTEPGTGAIFRSAGILVLGLRAYLVENLFLYGVLRVFDVTDPVSPVEIESARSAAMFGTPTDVAGEEGTVVVAMGTSARSLPASLYVYDVTDPNQARWVGAASVTSGALEGFLNRVVVKDGRAYTATGKRGVHVVDLAKAREIFNRPGMQRDLTTDGRGYGQEAVVGAIQVRRPDGKESMLYDLDAGGFVLGGQSQTLVVATGFMTPLVIVDPQYLNVVWQGTLRAADGSAEMTTGQAIGLGRVNDQDVAVVTGGGLMGGASKSLLATVDLSDPENPRVLGILDLTQSSCRSASDVLVKDTTAFVGGGDCVVLVNLDGPVPTLAGVLTGIGGRLALGDAGILYGSATGRFGGADPLGGVRTATLGSLAIVDGTDPVRLVVTQDQTRVVEDFKLKFRVIPKDHEVKAAKLEFRAGETTVFQIPVTISQAPDQTQGRGELSVPFGFAFPRAGTTLAVPRLVVNQGTDTELVSLPRAWNLSAFEVTLSGDEGEDPAADRGEDGAPMYAGEPENPIIGEADAESDELRRRFDDATLDNPARPFTVTWHILGGGEVLPPTRVSADGTFEASVDEFGTSVAGIDRTAIAMTQQVVLGQATVPMLPGPAAEVTVHLPLAGPGADGIVPADGKTEVELVVEGRDGDGNAVADGTVVHCRVDGDGAGEILGVEEQDPVTTDGTAVCKYRVGKYGTDIVVAEVDGVPGQVEIQSFLLRPTLRFERDFILVGEPADAVLTVETFAPGDTPANGTEVGWLSEGEFVAGSTQLFQGEARVRLLFRQEGIYSLVAVVGSEVRVASVAVAEPETLLQIRVNNRMIAADRTTDGTVSLPTFDGGRREVPVKATAQVEVSSGTPGERVRLGLGTFNGPNRMPEAHYLMDVVRTGGVVPDLYGRHPGEATAGVTASPDAARGGGSYAFDGSGVVRIPATGPLVQPLGLHLSLLVKPAPGSAGGTLIRREGSFALVLVPEGEGYRLRLSAVVGNDERVVESESLLAADQWIQVHAGFFSGEMSVVVGAEEVSGPLTILDPGSGDLLVGESFAGKLDDLFLYHATGEGAALLAIVDEAGVEHEELEATFDSTGRAFFNLRSRGARFGTPGVFEVLDDQPVDVLEQQIRGNFVGLRAKAVDTLRERKGSGLWAFTQDMAAVLTLMALDLVEGTDENSPPPFLIYEAIVGTFTKVVGTIMDIRDVVLMVDAWMSKRPTDKEKVMANHLGTHPKVPRAARAIDAIKAMRRLIKRGWAAVHFTSWARRAATDPVVAKRLEKTLQAVLLHGDEVADATADVIGAVGKRWSDLDNLEKTLRAADDLPAVAKALKGILTAHNPQVVSDVLTMAGRSTKITPKALEGIVKAVRANPPPSPGRMRRMAENFPDHDKVWEKIDDLAEIQPGGSTVGLKKLLNQLTSKRKPNVYIQDAANASLDYGKKLQAKLGGKIDEFERRVAVPKTTPGQVQFFRQYDLSKKLPNGKTLDVDVKDWAGFSAASKISKREAKKLQKDIIIKWTTDQGFDNLGWAIRNTVAGKRQEIVDWMLKQFDSRLVRSRIPFKADRDLARQRFQQALAGLLEFF